MLKAFRKAAACWEIPEGTELGYVMQKLQPFNNEQCWRKKKKKSVWKVYVSAVEIKHAGRGVRGQEEAMQLKSITQEFVFTLRPLAC